MLPIPPDYIPLAELFTGWWRGLQSLDKNGAERKIAGQVLPPNRKALAQLRRVNIEEGTAIPAIDIVTALTIDEFWDLIGRLKASDKLSKEIRTWIDQNDWEPFAIAAATLARVRLDTNSPHKPGSTAKMLGTPRNPEPGSKTIFDEARFKRLLRSRDDPPDLLAQARRVAAILEREAPIGDLAASLVLWNARPDISNPIRRDWAFQYYQRDFTAAAEPDANVPAPPA
jgi:CRISPR type I-E-associated protein CasB/Cse2